MLKVRDICDAATYRQFRQEWTIEYKQLSHQIRDARSICVNTSRLFALTDEAGPDGRCAVLSQPLRRMRCSQIDLVWLRRRANAMNLQLKDAKALRPHRSSIRIRRVDAETIELAIYNEELGR